MLIKCDDIKIGERVRKDLGELDSLIQSIDEIGLLQPIGITKDNELIFGQRRVAACMLLGWEDIEAVVINIDDIVRGEYDENCIRKDFTMSERAAIKLMIEPKLKEDAKERQEETQFHGGAGPAGPVGRDAGPAHLEGETRDKVAYLLGVGRTKMKQEEVIMSSGNQDIIDKVDAGELSTEGAYNEIKKEERAADIQQQRNDIEEGNLELPEGKFEVIVIDPPWPYDAKFDPKGRRSANPYPEMSLDELKEIDLPASDDCVLWLWTTHKFLKDSFDLMNTWRFDYKAILTWNKEKMGMGHWLRMQTEFCLLGIKGKPFWDNTTERDIITEPRRKHSQKPDSFYEMVNKICPGRKIDYFARDEREGYEVYGNEV